MKNFNLKKTLFITGVLLALSTICIPQIVLAQQALSEAEKQQREELLKKELARVEAEIAANTIKLNAKQKETSSIARDVEILNYQISQAKLKIRQKQIEIERLGGDINVRVKTIRTLSEQIEADKESLSELLRATRNLDNTTLTEVVLDTDTLSGFFVDLDSFSFIQSNVHDSFKAMRNNQVEATKEKVGLERRQSAEIDAKRVIEVETSKIQAAEAEKKRLLSIAKTEEAGYKNIIAAREAERAAIRNALFKLRDSTGSITFGQAVDMAVELSAKTGVRPAFALAILKQETNIGQNLGTCNRPGDPVTKQYDQIMHPTRDIPPFLRIVAELGLDPRTTPLSCPLSYGYGGAMGPAQFIPSTWEPYKARIAAVTGNNPPSPWRPLDAFAASQLLLRDLGAAGGGYTAERTAALRYYAGGNWADSRNAFYGDSVMRIATDMQAQIDILRGN
ncbi:MAG: hypothetical protein QG609_503 [Patescibacteria group bacterium]|nr:hypothetical protein [Patescibacteria group bacterium]